jgi:tetratricopeptide (TPR) repeat protein
MKLNYLSKSCILQTAKIIFLFSCLNLFAQGNKKGTELLITDQGKYNTVRAVIVGISEYMNIQSLEYAHKDAIAFYDYLRSQAGGSVDSNNIKLLINENASAALIFGALDWLTSESQEGDLAIFYFSGHGDLETKTIRQNGFLLAYDTPDAAYMSGGTIGISYLQDYLETIVQKGKSSVILISDACKSGKLAGGLEGVTQTTAALNENWENIVKILSSQPGELSYESNNWGTGAGVFTYYLLRGLMGMADLNTDKNVSLKELDMYLSTKIPPETNFEQNPSIVGNAKTVLTKVDSLTFAMIMNDEKGMASGELLAMKGNETTSSTLDTNTSNLIKQFQFCLKSGPLISSNEGDKNALDIYNELKYRDDLKAVVSSMRNSLIASLQDKSQTIIYSFLKGKVEEADSIDFSTAYDELSGVFSLIDSSYILYNDIKAKQFFMASLFYYSYEYDKRIELLISCLNLQPDAAYAYCELGRAYHDAKRYDDAIANYGKAIDLTPRWKYPYYNTGIVYADLKQNDSAIEYYQKAIEIDPYYTDALNNLGLVYNNMGDKTKAIEFYTKAIEIDPNYKLANYNLGIIYGNIGDVDKAIDYYKKAIEIDPYYTDSYNNLGLIYNDIGDKSKAIEYYQKALETDPNYQLAYYNLGVIYSDLGEIDKAIINYNSSVEIDPNYTDAYNNLGLIYYNQGDYSNAIEYFNTTLGIDPNYKLGYYNLGIVYYDLGNYDEAIKNFQKATEIDPSYTDAYNYLGLIYYKQGDHSNAIEYYNQALGIDPNYKLGYYNLGIVYYDLGNDDEAIKNFQKTTEIDPGYTDAFNYLGIIYYNNGDQPKAIEYYDKTVEIDPNYKLAYYNLGLVYSDMENTEKAIQNFTKTIKLDSNYINAYDKVGIIYYQRKDYESGIKIYNKYIQFYPADSYGYQMRGLNYFYNGDFDNALNDLQTVIEITPDVPDGYYNLACYYSVKNNAAESIANLEKAFQLGYNNFDHLEKDSDLDNIRSRPEYAKLIEHYKK